MTSGIEKSSVDLDSIFAPIHAGWNKAVATGIEIAGVDLNQRYAQLSSGTAAAVQGILGTGGADLSTLFAAINTTGVIVATQPTNVTGSAAAGSPSGTVASGSTTCTGGKGGGTYTYQWIQVTGPAVTFSNPTSATTHVSATVNAATTINGTFYCRISDGVTTVNTNTVSFSLQNTSAAFSPVTHAYTATGSGTQTIPAGPVQMVLEVKGGGAGPSDSSTATDPYLAGGGGGAYVRSVIALTSADWGKTIDYFVPSAGAQNLNGNGTSGESGTISSGTYTLPGTLTAGGGLGAAGNGVGGTAAGGNQVNIDGFSGIDNGAGGQSGSPGQYFDTGNAYGHGSTVNTFNATGGFVCFHFS